MQFKLATYQPVFDPAIANLEKGIVQGKGIRLKILKKHFLDRSLVFPRSNPCIAMKEDEVIGTAIGAETKLMVNGRLYTTGFVLDAKVHSSFRNQGIGTLLAKQQKDWFRNEGWEKNFTTLKLSNAAVIRLSAKALENIWLIPFVYLTIPTSTSVSSTFSTYGTDNFSVQLFDKENLDSGYYTSFSSGLGVFHTWMLYQLRIEKLSWLYRQALGCLKRFAPKRYALLPKENEVMKFGTLFNLSNLNITDINEALRHLQAIKIDFLLVCCRKGDSIYRNLKKYSINTYNYYILADFPLTREDEISIDVRCL